MRSIGARLALWYAIAATATMVCLFFAGRHLLEARTIAGLDLLEGDEFAQIRSSLGPDYDKLSRDEIQARLTHTAITESVLFYVQIEEGSKGTLFRSPSLLGKSIPVLAGSTFYNAMLPPSPFEIRVGAFRLGSMDILIACSKEQVRSVMLGYEQIFYGLIAAMLLISAGLGYALSRYALYPLRLIQETANHISSDNLAERIPVSSVRDEIYDLATLLNQMFDRLESSFISIRRFTAEASHELKTPLSLVRLQAEKMLVDGGLTEGQEEALMVQMEEISHLNQIIEELLFLSRAEARAITLNCQVVDPAKFLQGFIQDARVLAESRGVSLQDDFRGTGEVALDARWIRQVLLNLVSNALNVSQQGQTIWISSSVGPSGWTVAIEDQGPGVPPDQRERIFERFVRLDPEKAAPGSGLGLAISRSIVSLHKGRIRALPAGHGRGLRVEFELPPPA